MKYGGQEPGSAGGQKSRSTGVKNREYKIKTENTPVAGCRPSNNVPDFSISSRTSALAPVLQRQFQYFATLL